MCNRYVNDVRECLRNRIQCGMLQDEALLIQENCYMELTQINEIKEKHKVFEGFHSCFEIIIRYRHVVN